MNEKELLPCPFCGSTSLKLECKSVRVGWTGIDARVDRKTYSVRCNVCHARSGMAGGKVIDYRFSKYRGNVPDWATTGEKLKEMAIEAWNIRLGGIHK